MGSVKASATFQVVGSTPTGISTPCTSQTFGLWLSGKSLACVKKIQFDLNLLINAGLTIDGYYGPATRNAVVAFQGTAGITIDGVVGPQTWKAMQTMAFNDGPRTAEQLQI